MGMIACTECAQSVSDRAETCPHCGFKLIATTYWSFGRVLIAIILLLGLVTCISNLSEAPTPAAPKSEADIKADRDRTARYACKSFIEKSLHDPSSADLSQWTSAVVTHPSANTTIYEVYMQVRAKNAFNALRLSTMVCRVQRDGDNLKLISLTQVNP